MTSNETAIQWQDIIGLYITTPVLSLSVIIATFACLIIIILTYITPNLHSPTNLLVSTTCLCTLSHLFISTMNNFMFYTAVTSSDWSCRIRGYLYYVTLNLVIYSYVIQAISRLFWTVLYRHRSLLTMKCHRYLIISQIGISFILPLSSIITKDIVFRPFALCLVAMKHTIHVFYLLIIGCIIPFLTIAVLYAIIYRHISRSTAHIRQSLHGTKRDAELARNILILLSIFLFGSVPTVIYIILSNKINSVPYILFLIAITAPSVAIAIEKTMTIVLNKDIRKALKLRWFIWFPICRSSTTRVHPITHEDNTHRRTINTVSGGRIHAANLRKEFNVQDIQLQTNRHP